MGPLTETSNTEDGQQVLPPALPSQARQSSQLYHSRRSVSARSSISRGGPALRGYRAAAEARQQEEDLHAAQIVLSKAAYLKSQLEGIDTEAARQLLQELSILSERLATQEKAAIKAREMADAAEAQLKKQFQDNKAAAAAGEEAKEELRKVSRRLPLTHSWLYIHAVSSHESFFQSHRNSELWASFTAAPYHHRVSGGWAGSRHGRQGHGSTCYFQAHADESCSTAECVQNRD